MDPIRVGGKNPFEYQKPNDDQVQRIEEVRQGCKQLFNILLGSVQLSRERSLAITKLEEVSMWANKGIVFEKERN